MTGAVALVVDDHPSARSALAYALRGAYEVVVAATVREALAVLSRLDVARDRRRGEAPPHRAPQGGRVVTP